MKTLLLVLSAVGLTGCAVYPTPAYEPYGYGGYGDVGGPPVVVAPQPVYIYGSGVYRSGGYPHAYPRGYVAPLPPPPPRAFFPHGPRPGVQGPRPNVHTPRTGPGPRQGHGARDRDGDGIPNRLDRDRDGDGVRNRNDRRPGNPNRQ